MRVKEFKIGKRIIIDMWLGKHIGIMLDYAQDSCYRYLCVVLPFVSIDFGFKRSKKK